MTTTHDITSTILARLNAQDAIDNGLSNGDAHLVGDCVNFTYPAPVIGGACCGVIRVYDDGRVFDDVQEQTFANFAEWLADLESMIEEA